LDPPSFKTTWASDQWGTIAYKRNNRRLPNSRFVTKFSFNETGPIPKQLISEPTPRVVDSVNSANPTGSKKIKKSSKFKNLKTVPKISKFSPPKAKIETKSKNPTPTEALTNTQLNLAKTMCSVLKSTHHLSQFENCPKPKLIAKQIEILKLFPKPFASNPQLKERLDKAANTWGDSLCASLSDHYHLIRNEALFSLESCPEGDAHSWPICLTLAQSWTRSSFKRIDSPTLSLGLELIETANKKRKDYLHKPATIDVDESPPMTIAQDDTSSESSFSVVPPCQSTCLTLPADVLSGSKISGPTDSNSSVVLSGGKKHWRLPVISSFSKLLITDDSFVGPVSNDFYHVTLPEGSVWDVNNLIKYSPPSPGLSLVIIHVGLKSLQNPTSWSYVGTVLKKLKFSAPNAKAFFTGLFSKAVDTSVSAFNSFCKDKFPDCFLDSDLRLSPFSTEAEKSELLWQNWCAILLSLNLLM
jgi:hypothetical protein